MDNIINEFQLWPLRIDPIAFSIGFLTVHWYGLMYLAAFGFGYGLLRWRQEKGESVINKHELANLLIWVAAGALIGGRLGYFILYDFGEIVKNPLVFFNPWDGSGNWVGISGMSFFGGATGVFLSGLAFSRKSGVDFWRIADWVVPVVPLGYFFVRIGNFINGEIVGRPTEAAWGMYFPAAGEFLLRHPSQLYQAFFGGLVLFAVFWFLRNKSERDGRLILGYLFAYGIIRFGLEFFIEPDENRPLIIKLFTFDQLLALLTVLVAVVFWKTHSAGRKLEKKSGR